MAGTYVPTVRSRRLTHELRRLRSQVEMTYERVADEMGWSVSKIYRIEHDRTPIKERDVRRLLTLYGVEDAEKHNALLTLARDQNKDEGWWHRYGDVLPEWFQVYVSLESDAATLKEYESELVPGLLQTEDYARAILRVAPDTPPEAEMERLVAARMARQEALTRADRPVRLWAVLNEAVIRRVVGGGKTMQRQLRHLLEMARLPNVAIQVLPFEAGAHTGMRNDFTLMSFPEATDHRIVYVEMHTGSLYLEKPRETDVYSLRFDYLRAKALGAEESEEMLDQVAKVMH